MTEISTINTNDLPIFHPAAHYNSPGDVLNDRALSVSEKRIILSSWASDMYAVESCPALREVPGIGHRIRLTDILAALRQLDSEDDPPPRGGAAVRLRRPYRAAPLFGAFVMVTPVILTLVLAGQVSAMWVVPWFAWQAGLSNAEHRSPNDSI